MYKLNKIEEYERLLPQVELGDTIPKKIYLTSKMKSSTDSDIQKNIEHLQTLNPSWSLELFFDEDIEPFILTHYGVEVLERYKRISPEYGAAKADLFRYLLLYQRGGVYLDLKSSMQYPLDEVLLPTDKYILSHWDNHPGGKSGENTGHFKELNKILPRGEWQQWHVICVAGHPFLREVIKRVLYNIDHYHPWRVGVARFGVLRTTGPVAYTLAIEDVRKHLSPDMYRFVDHAELLGLEYSIFERPGMTRTHHAVVGSYYMKKTPVVELGYGPLKKKIINTGTLILYVLEILYDKSRNIVGLPPTNMT